MTIANIVAKTSRATTRASFAASNGKESANKSVGIDKKKQKQAANTSAAAVTRGTRLMRATLAARTVQASQPAASGTPSPTKQSKREGRQQQIPSWWIPHKKRMWVVMCCLALARSRARAVPQNVPRKKIGQ